MDKIVQKVAEKRKWGFLESKLKQGRGELKIRKFNALMLRA